MNYKIVCLITVMSCLLPFFVTAQQVDKVLSKGDILHLEQKGEHLKITFYLPAPQNEFFNVEEIEIISKGRIIKATALTGPLKDIGSGEYTIYWEVLKDTDELERVDDMRIMLSYTDFTRNRIAEKPVLRTIVESDNLPAEEIQEEKLEVYHKLSKDDQNNENKYWNRRYGHFRLGMKGGAGMSMANLEFENNRQGTPDMRSIYVKDWNAGLTARIHFTRFLGLGAEVRYGRQVAALDFSYQVENDYSNYYERVYTDYKQKLSMSYWKNPVYLTMHLNENFAFIFGKYWTRYKKVKLEGITSQEWERTYLDGSSGFEEKSNHLNMNLLDDEYEVDGEKILDRKVSGMIMGIEVDSKGATLGVYYEVATEGLVNHEYFENSTPYYQGVNLQESIIPEMNTTDVYLHQVSAQLTIWF